MAARNDIAALFRENERITSLAAHAVGVLLLANAVNALVQFGHYLVPAWQGSYLVWICAFVAAESMYSRRLVKELDFFSRDQVFYRITEWVVILVGFKLLLYARNGFSRLPADLLTLQTDFIATVFDGEYLFGILCIGIAWVLAGRMGELFGRLEGDEKLLLAEREARFGLDRKEARSSLINLVVGIGALITVLISFVFLEQLSLGGNLQALRPLFTGILFYFFLTLVLLSLTQFAILRVRWSLDRIPVRRSLAGRWIAYSLAFLLLLAAVAVLLPTGYSVSLIDFLRLLLSLLLGLLNIILFLVSLPVVALLALFSFLMGKPRQVEPLQVKPPARPFQAPDTSIFWLESLKSLLFWFVFFGIITFSIYYYFRQNQALVARLRGSRVFRAMSGALAWLQGLFRKAEHTLAQAAEAGRRRLQSWRRGAPARPAGYLHLRRLDPRQRIFFYYLALVRRGGEQGYPRRPAETPSEYSRSLEARLPEVQDDLTAMTDHFNEARYSRHPVDSDQAGLVQKYWMHIRKAIKRV